MSFPLLKSPIIIIQEVLKQFELNDLFLMSLCSQNSFKIVQFLRPKSIRLRFDQVLVTAIKQLAFKVNDVSPCRKMVEIDLSSNLLQTVPRAIRYITIGGYTVPMVMGYECYVTYWDDMKIALKVLTAHISDLFDVDVDWVVFHSTDIDTLEWINERQVKPIRSGFITGTKGSEPYPNTAECYRLLTQVRLDHLYWEASVPDNFAFNEPENGKIRNFESLDLHRGEWVTVENLKSLSNSCIQLEVENSKLTSSDLNEFLKYWINEGSNRLQFLKIEMKPLDLEVVYAGLSKVLIDEPKKYESKFHPKMEFPPEHYEIHRDDGSRASISYINEMKTFQFHCSSNFNKEPQVA